ncbi:MAG: hypothetical protein U5J99_07745 [Parvularculaceae bacterium]|nr:hypothetical protein [Parvularculaceae bacterium]
MAAKIDPKDRPVFDINDVDRALNGSSSGRRAKTSSSRRGSVTSSTIKLTHMPTGVSITGQIEEGRYARSEMKKLRNALEQKLMVELEKLVMKHMRIPRR